ncbi:hypothetical protein P3T76_013926 [Phytophthora citrophthora]|uniref:Uncharacterized protein n=1 Tax=Phytophthora citrophthora TaxID=4793 RepID=A0AAD9G259_9STRA|nr:hypothetical protein P3T76_013926 [Phytophthora citrophthora]
MAQKRGFGYSNNVRVAEKRIPTKLGPYAKIVPKNKNVKDAKPNLCRYLPGNKTFERCVQSFELTG